MFVINNIDLNKIKLSAKTWISQDVIEKVTKHLEKKDQILFFLNRRGFAPFAFCKKCLNNYLCPNCSIHLVYHKNNKNLLCHYCGYKGNLKRKCNDNDTCDFIFSGPGVERVSEELEKIFSFYESEKLSAIPEKYLFKTCPPPPFKN